MIAVTKTNLRRLVEYSNHLKAMPIEDRSSRFGTAISDYGIDQIMLQIAYHPEDHQLWFAYEDDGDEILGWGHMAQAKPNVWELAVSVEKVHQRKGVGDKLITEMLDWAAFRRIGEVFMHCIEDNRVIQHLAAKHELKTVERGYGERTAALEVPPPSFLEQHEQFMKEQTEIRMEIGQLYKRLANMWLDPSKI
jgi:GNAT superfamily N-acetyltransferase